MTVVTRFAPSPTGFLHIGGARTALFNWLHARHSGGKFLLRIEDTDRARSTPEATQAIFDGLKWIGLTWDENVVHQSERSDRHAEVVTSLLEMGHAYRCWCTPEELQSMREQARKEHRPMRYDGRWRDRDPSEAPKEVAPVIRVRTPFEGETRINDAVQGSVKVDNAEIDDFVILRADGTPTYMLSVVVDDHDMGVTDIIRGDDHLTNAFRQHQIFDLMGWDAPRFAHIPLIHGPDGKKLSKRHGALGVEAYRDDGFLPEALRNALLRLGWAHGDDEVISTEQAVEWFDIANVGQSAARFDLNKLLNLNTHYLRETGDVRLTEEIVPLIEANGVTVGDAERTRLLAGMPGLKERTKTLKELASSAAFYARRRPLPLDEKAERTLDEEARILLTKLAGPLGQTKPWSEETLENKVRAFAEEAGCKLGVVAQPVRAALTGGTVSPGVFNVMETLGREETLGRIEDVAHQAHRAHR